MVQPDSKTMARVDTAISVSVFMIEFLDLSIVSIIQVNMASVKAKIAGKVDLYLFSFPRSCTSIVDNEFAMSIYRMFKVIHETTPQFLSLIGRRVVIC